jgi:hypothetical protein
MDVLLAEARDRLVQWEFKTVYDSHAILGAELLGKLGTTTTFFATVLPVLWELFDPAKKTWKMATVSELLTKHSKPSGKSRFAQWMASQLPPTDRDNIFQKENFNPTHPLAYLVAAVYSSFTGGGEEEEEEESLAQAHADTLLLFVKVVADYDVWYAVLTLLLCFHYSERVESLVALVLASTAQRVVSDFQEGGHSVAEMSHYIFLPAKALREDIIGAVIREGKGDDHIPMLLQHIVFPGVAYDPFKAIEWDTLLMILRTSASPKDMALLLRVLYPTTLDFNLRQSSPLPYKGPLREEILRELSNPFFYRVLVARGYIETDDRNAIHERLTLHVQSLLSISNADDLNSNHRHDVLLVVRHLEETLLEALVLPLILPACREKHYALMVELEKRGILDDMLRQTARDVFQQVDKTPLTPGELLLLLELGLRMAVVREETGSYSDNVQHQFLVCMGTWLLDPNIALDNLPYAQVFFTSRVPQRMSLKWLRTQVMAPMTTAHFQGIEGPRQLQWMQHLAHVHRGLGEDSDEIQTLLV